MAMEMAAEMASAMKGEETIEFWDIRYANAG
jgi:hypothetical protein